MFLISLISVYAETFVLSGSTNTTEQGQSCDSEVGEVKQLQQLSMGNVCDYDTNDGNGVYCYCTWETSDSQSGTIDSNA